MTPDDRTVSGGPTLADEGAEARRILGAVGQDQLPLRLAGGTAFLLRCPHAQRPPLGRPHGDLDFVGLSRSAKRIQELFVRLGYTPNKRFNALHGEERLLFSDEARGRDVDVIFDRFRMCHVIDLRERIEVDAATLPLVDLLICKMQVVQLNEKDVRDVQAMLLDFPVGSGDGDTINLDRLCRLLSNDWGLCHSVQINLGRVRNATGGIGLTAEQEQRIQLQAGALLEALERCPKSLRWTARARIGERLPWYELPDEVEHD